MESTGSRGEGGVACEGKWEGVMGCGSCWLAGEWWEAEVLQGERVCERSVKENVKENVSERESNFRTEE